jgi:hypothetical protein
VQERSIDLREELSHGKKRKCKGPDLRISLGFSRNRKKTPV